VVRLALQAEHQQLLMSSASDSSAMACDWLSAIEAGCDLLDEAFACVAAGLEMSEPEVRASWASRSDEERRRWIERSSALASQSVRAALLALLHALDDVAVRDATAELDGLLAWLPQREQLVFGLTAAGPAAIRSLFAFAILHADQPVIALIDRRLWLDTREQLDDRTRALLDSGRLPPLLVPSEPVASNSSRPARSSHPLDEPVFEERSTASAHPMSTRGASTLTADGARSAAEQRLYELLQAEPVTRDLFELNVRMPFTFGPARAEVDFVCRELRLVLEVDGFYHFQRADAYRRDRRKDVLLQHQGYLVSRHLADDVHERGGEVLRAVRELVRRRRRSFRRESPT
jgi:very-short-patch-repair endonuclease